MKLKIALTLAVLALTGCQMPVGDVVRTSDIGQARMAADAQATQGDLKWKNGTGIVYQRNLNQCGKNCADQAELALKLDKERAEREAQGNPEYDRIVAREKEAYRRMKAENRCASGISLRAAALQDKYKEATIEYGFNSKESRAAGTEYIKFRKQAFTLLNQCVEYGLKQDESN